MNTASSSSFIEMCNTKCPFVVWSDKLTSNNLLFT